MMSDSVPEPPAAKKEISSDRSTEWENRAYCITEPKPTDVEIAEYISTQLSENPDPDSVREWWKFNREYFPALSKLARFILSVHQVLLQTGHLVYVGQPLRI